MVRHDPGRQDGTAAGLGVLLGADGVTGRRTGIGRVTLEVARTLCNLSAAIRAGSPTWRC
jgi:hypothetical protein